ENLRLDMTKLGFEPESLVKFEKAILKPYGMVLVTGPTGSGKTNTLYSSIARLNQPDTNIMTAEDPVEFQLHGVNQVQMKVQIRRICKDCTEVNEVPHQTLLEEGYTPEEAKTVKIQKGKGCGVCNNTGYKGRTGLYEVMEVDDEIRELVLVGASAVELKKKAI